MCEKRAAAILRSRLGNSIRRVYTEKSLCQCRFTFKSWELAIRSFEWSCQRLPGKFLLLQLVHRRWLNIEFLSENPDDMHMRLNVNRIEDCWPFFMLWLTGSYNTQAIHVFSLISSEYFSMYEQPLWKFGFERPAFLIGNRATDILEINDRRRPYVFQAAACELCIVDLPTYKSVVLSVYMTSWKAWKMDK